MSHLAVAIQDYLRTTDDTAARIETDAGIGRMAIGSIINETQPRPARMGKILAVIGHAVAAHWLECYIKDGIPEEWRPRVRIIIHDLSLRETSALPASPLQRSLQRLELAAKDNKELGQTIENLTNSILGKE